MQSPELLLLFDTVAQAVEELSFLRSIYEARQESERAENSVGFNRFAAVRLQSPAARVVFKSRRFGVRCRFEFRRFEFEGFDFRVQSCSSVWKACGECVGEELRAFVEGEEEAVARAARCAPVARVRLGFARCLPHGEDEASVASLHFEEARHRRAQR